MRTISMDYRIYQADLKIHEAIGHKEGLRRGLEIAKQIIEKNKNEAVCILAEEFGGEGHKVVEKACEQLGLIPELEAYWRS